MPTQATTPPSRVRDVSRTDDRTAGGSRPALLRLFRLGLLLLPLTSFALDPAKSVYQFNIHSWRRQDGLPGNKVNAVAQSTDGYVWIGTQNGLVRFDGQEFTTIPTGPAQAPSQEINHLAAAREGGVWFSVGGGGFGRYAKGTVFPIGDARWSQRSMRGRTILEAHDGAVWTGGEHALGRWVNANPAETLFDESIIGVKALCEDRSHRIWIGTEELGVVCWAAGRLSRLSDESLQKHVISALAADANGRLWVATERGLACYGADGTRQDLPAFSAATTALLVDQHGTIWIGTTTGLVRFREGEFQFLRQADGLGNDYVTALCEDREGSLWVGTQDGLSQLSDLKFPTLSAREGFYAGGGLSVCAARSGGVWITATGGIAHFDGKTFTHYTDEQLLPNRYVKLGFEARNGDFYWVDGDKNISVLREGKLSARHPNSRWPEALAEDGESVLAGIGPTLVRLKDGQLQPYAFKGDLTPDFQWFDKLWIGRDDAIWVASYNGVFRVKDGEFRQWATADGLSGNRVHYVFEDEDGTIWAGLATGIARIRGDELRNITAANGLFDNRTYAIVPDDRGYFWINSGRGIYRVSRESLNRFADGQTDHVACEAFTGEESVKSTDRIDQEFSGCRSADGRIWFPNPWGVVMIDPSNFVMNRVPPPVHLQRILVNGADVTRQDAATLRVGDDRLEFFFVALSYISPKRVRLRYQLDGFDPSWVDAGPRRSAQYKLEPGRYTFRVQAANADGVWNTAGDTIAIELPPPFYATYWFYAACGLTGALGLFSAFRWKIRHMRARERRLREQNDRLEARISERTSELAKSVSLLHATLESVTDGIIAVDHAGRLVSYNTKFATICGVPSELLANGDVARIRQHVAGLLKDPAHFLRRLEELEATPEASSFDVFELKDGRTLERYASPQRVDQRNAGIVVNWRDITERRRAAAAAAEASALLDALLTHTIDFVYFKDLDSRFVRYSRALLRHFRLTEPDALRGKTDFDCYAQDRAQSACDDEQEIIRTGQPIVGKLETTTLADGRPSWLLTTKMPWRDEHGAIVGTFGVSHDITAIKSVEAALAHERDLLRALLDSSPDKIYFKDLQSRFLRASKAQAASFRAASPEEMVGKTDFDYFTDEHARPAFDDEQEIIRTGQSVIGKVEKETWNDGRETWALTSKMALRDNTGTIIGTLGVTKDITELKQAESKLEQLHRQLVETSREAGMAEVATSVLHNVGNVLNSVNVSTSLVSNQVRDSKAGNLAKITAMLREHADDLAAFLVHDPKGQKLPAYLELLGEQLAGERKAMADELEHLRKNIEHIKDIVAMQQNYAKVCGVTESVPLTEIIEDSLRINSGALDRHEVRVVRDYQVKPVLTIERHKVIQVLVNLIRNSKYACDESGRTDKQITIRVVQEAARIKVMVIDNGIGIAAENLTRIFAHGFTTRKEGHGFGLHSGSLTARDLGGALTAYSEGIGTGATFTLDLPVSDPARQTTG